MAPRRSIIEVAGIATIVMSVAALVVLFFDSTPKLVHFSSRSRRTKGPTAV